MRHWLTGLLTMFTVAVLTAHTQSGTPFRIEKLDAALDEIIASDAMLQTLGDRFALTEGPVWVPGGPGGYLLFSDNAANVIYKWAATSPLSVFLEKSGFTGTDNSRVGAQTVAGRVAILLIGSNGLALDPQQRLVVTAMADRTVYRLEKDGTRTILADRYEGKRFNGPNDIVVKSDGAIYFTDSVWGLRGADKDPARELPFSGFFLIREGKVSLLGGDKDAPGMYPNGITLSPDEKFLYVTAGGRRTMRYEIMQDDTITNGRVFVEDERRRNARRLTWKSIYNQRRHARSNTDYVPAGQTARTASSSATGNGTAPSSLCDESRIRRCRQSWFVHHGLYTCLQGSDENSRRSSRTKPLAERLDSGSHCCGGWPRWIGPPPPGAAPCGPPAAGGAPAPRPPRPPRRGSGSRLK